MLHITELIALALLAALFGKLNGNAVFPQAHAGDWQEVQALEQVTREADHQGNFERAARSAEQCVAIAVSTKRGTGLTSASYYCSYYLSSALRNGRGLPRDEGQAFAILNDLAAKDPDGDAALTLAEDYLDGAGTPRNRIEAGVTLWRVNHGLWSIYGDYWGMCTSCEDFGQHEKAVTRRVDQELTKDEKTRADIIAVQRYPTIAARVRHRDRQIAIGVVTPVILIGALCWTWRARRTHRAEGAALDALGRRGKPGNDGFNH